MDPQKDDAPTPPGIPPSNRGPSAGARTEKEQPVKSPVLKQVSKKRITSEGSEGEGGEGGEDSTLSTKDKLWAKKRKLGSGKEAKGKSRNAIKPGDTSNNTGGERTTPASTKKRKPPKLTSSQKGNWLKEEDDIILHSKTEGMGWQEITDLVRAAGSFESDRTLTAVRLRYQKVLKDRDVELTAEELSLLQQAKIDIETTEKYRFIAERYKELSGGKDMSKRVVKKVLAPTKSEFNNVKGGSKSTKD